MNIIERVFCIDMHDSNEFNIYSGPAIVQSAMRINNCFEMYIRHAEIICKASASRQLQGWDTETILCISTISRVCATPKIFVFTQPEYNLGVGKTSGASGVSLLSFYKVEIQNLGCRCALVESWFSNHFSGLGFLN